MIQSFFFNSKVCFRGPRSHCNIQKNIARGTTDPGYCLFKLELSLQLIKTLPLALIPNLATKWHHLHQLQIWPTCMTCKFDHQIAPPALVAKLATRWRHLHKLQIWPPDGATCISSKFGHQMAPLALVANLTTRWRHLHKLQF